MRHNLPCEFPTGYDGTEILERLAQVLDPELDESILELGFVRSVQLRSGHVSVVLRLPTSWCAINFSYLMAEDVRRALLTAEGVCRVTVRLGDHCAAAEIEAAVNEGRPFAEAFPGETRSAASNLSAQGILRSPGTVVERPTGGGLRAGDNLRSTTRRDVDTGRDDCDPAARLRADRGWIGCNLAGLFRASCRTPPRLRQRSTSHRRSRRQAVFARAASRPLRGCPYCACRDGGQWFILSCHVKRASPRCCCTIAARKSKRETCTDMTVSTSL